MITEAGSDELMLRYADVGQLRQGVREDMVRRALEEWRASHSPQASDEPGEQHPDPDEAPPSDEAHDEYDPTPPEAS